MAVEKDVSVKALRDKNTSYRLAKGTLNDDMLVEVLQRIVLHLSYGLR